MQVGRKSASELNHSVISQRDWQFSFAILAL